MRNTILLISMVFFSIGLISCQPDPITPIDPSNPISNYHEHIIKYEITTENGHPTDSIDITYWTWINDTLRMDDVKTYAHTSWSHEFRAKHKVGDSTPDYYFDLIIFSFSAIYYPFDSTHRITGNIYFDGNLVDTRTGIYGVSCDFLPGHLEE